MLQVFATFSSSYSPAFLPLYCRNNCSHIKGFDEDNWAKFCDYVYFGIQSAINFDFDFVFICGKKPYADYVEGSYHITALCDGQIDCKNGADELGCPGRFYCSPNESSVEWVEEERVCDHVKDCANGQDECESCNFGALSSSNFLIRSIPILVFTVLIGVMVAGLNIWEGYKCYCDIPSSH